MPNNSQTLKDETPFGALLNPIRDLAANWDVDVAKELTEYAESLGISLENAENDDDEHAEFRVHMDSEQIDFAQAALLVQGSTSIYSKKVEYLYSLVYSVVSKINQVRGKNKTSGNGSTEPVENDAEAEALLNIDEVDFLSLDDVKTADPKSITMPRERLPPAGSLQDTTCIRPIPPMLTENNADGANLGRVNYKMMSAYTHPSGALVMEGCPAVDENLEALPQNRQLEAIEQNLADGDDVDNSGLPDFEAGDENGFLTPPPVVADNPDILIAIASSVKKSRGPRLLEIDEKPKVKPSPFTLLDPHDAHEEMASWHKPLKVGRTSRRPRKQKADLSTTFDHCNNLEADVDLVTQLLGELPRAASLRTYIYCEGLRASYRTVLRKRNALKRKAARRQTNTIQDLGALFEEEIEELGEGDADTFNDFGDNEDNAVRFDDDANEDIGPVPEFPALDDEDFNQRESSLSIPLERGLSPTLGRISDEFTRMAANYAETCRRYVQETSRLWEQNAIDTRLSERVKDWRDRILPILEEEEERDEFDISAYGESLLQEFRTKEKKNDVRETKLSTLFKAPAKYEVCRMFLASLQLANAQSIEIVQGKKFGVIDPSVRLLSGVQDKCLAEEKQFTPKRATRTKRPRQPGGTPLSARRKPLRARLQT